MEYRINGFEQLRAFYGWVMNNADKQVRPSHVSIYVFLLNQNNRVNWVEWFKCPFDLAMQGAVIGSRSTYYKCLDDLDKWGLIKYQRGVNQVKAPLISLVRLSNNGQAPVPLPEQPSGQASEQLSGQLPEHIYKLIRDNIKLVTEKLPSWIFNETQSEESSETIKELSDRWKLPNEATEEQQEIDLAVNVYRTYCDIYGKRAYEEILARDWIGKVRKIPADDPKKIPDVLRYAKKFNTFGYTRAANLNYLVTDWAAFRADAERAYLNNSK